MSHALLDTQKLRRYDERALDVLYRSIEELREKRLTRHEVFSIYNEGVRIVFAGHGLNYAPELNYALFYSKVRTLSPLVMTVKCFALRGESHAEVIRQGSPGQLIVAGTVRNRKFTGVSTTWMKGIQPDSGRHSFGLFMNDLLLDYYGIEREPGWSDQSYQIWGFA
ncbi:MAG: hypothetical protein JSV89_05390 [Spirochaetaceae bacterium]|nr:MAG: hypothetical protein JSV89_05390 [Spirochaetaceae bacterium]